MNFNYVPPNPLSTKCLLNYMGKDESKMSESILVANNQISIISSDSLIQELRYDNGVWKVVQSKYGPKVFYNRMKKMIWSIVGIDLNDEICKQINNFSCNLVELQNNIISLQEWLSTSLQTNFFEDDFIDCKILLTCSIDNHLYSCLLTASSKRNISYNQHLFLDDEPISLQIGAYAESYINNHLLNHPTNLMDKNDLLNISIEHINDVKRRDLLQPRYSFPIVAGDIYTVSMGNNGDIVTYINSQEAFF